MIYGFLFLTIIIGIGVYSILPSFKWAASIIVSIYVSIFMYLAIFDLPSAIRQSAERIATGKPFCLALPHLHRPVGQSLDLTILRARGSKFTPHLMLWVQEDNGTIPYNWSYMKRRFDQNLPNGVVQNCVPQWDFLTNLTTPKPGTHFIMGQEIYIIPPMHDAANSNDDYIALNFGVGGEIRRPRGSVNFDLARVGQWQKREMARNILSSSPSSTFRMDGEHGVVIWNFDAAGLPVQKFSCGQGTGCRITFVHESKLFNVFFRPLDIDDGPMVREQIEAIWQSFRIEVGIAAANNQ